MSQIESWVYMENGKLMLHTENDGYAFLRHGAEASNTEVTLNDLGYGSRLYNEAADLLARQNKRMCDASYGWCQNVENALEDIEFSVKFMQANPDHDVFDTILRKVSFIRAAFDEEFPLC